ncbi:MAG: cyanophycinase [Planctomycetota bacterium]
MKHLIVLFSVLAFTLPGLADEQEPPKGHLVIVGGGLKAENEPVYRAVLDRIPEDGTLGILPTASGIPEESGPGHAEDFQQYAGPNQKIVLLDIRNGDVDKANDPNWVEKIKSCDGLWFTGGDQSRIVATFRPEDGDTPAYAAMWDVLNRGGVIGGTSAGAAMMCDPMIKWGNSHEALLLGVVNDVADFGVGLGQGMGFLPQGILVDQHFFARGRLGRLMVAMREGVKPMAAAGFGIGENTALVVHLDEAQPAKIIGPNGVLLVVMRPQTEESEDIWFPPSAAMFMPDGSTLGVEPIGGRTATKEDLEKWISGSPRAYDGPLVVDVQMQEGYEGEFALMSNDHTGELFDQAQAALDDERNKPVESSDP